MENGFLSPSTRCLRFVRIVALFLTVFLNTLGTAMVAKAKPVALPLTIDYPLLKVLTIQSAFTDPGETARLFESDDGCTSIIISEPHWQEVNGRLRLEAHVALTTGKGIGDSCLLPVEWQGFVHLEQKPKFYPNWQLGFQPLASAILDTERKPMPLSGIIANLAEKWVFPYLSKIRFDLAPPVADLKQVLFPMLSNKMHDFAQKTIDSMRPGDVRVHPEHLRLPIIIEAAVAQKETLKETPAPLSPEEAAQFIRLWETWDAFLVHIIHSLAEKPLTIDEKQTLLDTLLETRHLFSVELTKESVEEDFVKSQFLWAWEQLSPIFRRHLTGGTPSHQFAYLTFFTASDALAILNTLGPSLGIEISREGLIRMARLMGELPNDQLSYPLGSDKRLRDILDFEPEITPKMKDQQPMPQSLDSESTGRQGALWHRCLLSLLSGPKVVHAAEKSPNTHPAAKNHNKPRISLNMKPEIYTWTVPKIGVDKYLDRVRALLNKTIDKVVTKKTPLKKYRKWLHHIVISTAWQESCFRQFHIKKRKVVYLRSYNGSSVGLMQINERVWRGIYDVNRLRWDIHYNAKAGCEILTTYLQRYALKKPRQVKSLKPVELAGVLYAMYNGGPRQFEKFVSRLNRGKLFLSDRLFKEKYIWVVDSKWSMINQCLVVG